MYWQSSFLIYLKILNHIFNLRIPLTPIADFLSVLILIFIIIPISFITAHFFCEIYKKLIIMSVKRPVNGIPHCYINNCYNFIINTCIY